MAQLNPFVRFNDAKCREAMTFYQSIFGGETTFMTLGDSPMAKDMPDKGDLIMHAELKSNKVFFSGSDMMRDKAIIGDNVGMSLNCSSEEELREIFNKLSEGGEIFMAPEMQFWGGVFGVLTDKYGVEWMLNYQKEEMGK